MAEGSWFVEVPPAEPAESSASFERLYRAFLAARAALGVALIAAQLIAAALSTPPAQSTLTLSAYYAMAAVALWLLPQLRRGASARSLARISSPHWWSAIGMDLVLFGVLHALDPSGVNYGALFVMPVLMAAVLCPRMLALATAAMATLGLLAAAVWALLLGADVGLRTTQAGLVGSGLFAVSLLAGELSARLAREEKAARGSLALARQQESLNRLVIDEMQEGVLVVDRRGRVRAMNPASRDLLGASSGELSWQLRGRADWQPLVQALERAYAGGAGGTGAEVDVALPLESGVSRSLRLRLRFTRQREGSEELCVLFVEDNRELLARTRQEKLAAMGRVSVGIAHEIRNPLAAIAQANALIAEDVAGMRAEQLTKMVASNVQRLKRLVDDVTEIAPGMQPETQPLDASALVQEACDDWARVNDIKPGAQSRFQLQIGAPGLLALFDAEHLRRVLVNLLDNAHRHAEAGVGAIAVVLARHGDDLELVVRSAGPPVPPEIERHLFEPFFSTRSRGSGLGLYICRELCERHAARIDYRRSADAAANEFRVQLRMPSAPMTSPLSR
ncbi:MULTISPECIES: PAS domain-containing sensor histidine kinase [unclassified Roseateles]|uniref:sensor histidine kinase n=1 Tax=unclassified Roseateles TaxID=2626991 RepID=UPI0006F639E5|nr:MULTISPECIES: ATP-binding protein [unclassified Roseateles]